VVRIRSLARAASTRSTRRPLPATRVASRCPYCGQADSYDRLQRVGGHRSHDELGLRRRGGPRSVTIPRAAQPNIDRINSEIYERVNNGVYKAGFATTQAAYEEGVEPLSRHSIVSKLCLASSDISAAPASRRRIGGFSSRSCASIQFTSATSSAISDAFQNIPICGPTRESSSSAQCARDGQFRTHQTALL